MLSASRRQPHLLHVSAVDRRQTVNGQELTMCDIDIRNNTGIEQTDGQTELAKQYRAMHRHVDAQWKLSN